MGLRLHVRSGWTQGGTREKATFALDASLAVIGRGSSADVPLPHPSVSTKHAVLRVQGTGWVIIDENSRNGTVVNGQRLPPGRPKSLRTGDKIEIGGFGLEVEVVALAEATSTEETAALARRLLRESLGEPLAAPVLTILNGDASGESVRLDDVPMSVLLGRGDACGLRLPDEDASREHAEVLRRSDGVWLRDLGSKQGCFVNEVQVSERRLRDRDELRLGATVLVFEDPAVDALRDVFGAEEEELSEPPSGLWTTEVQVATAEPVEAPNVGGALPVASPSDGDDVLASPSSEDVDSGAPAAEETSSSASEEGPPGPPGAKSAAQQSGDAGPAVSLRPKAQAPSADLIIYIVAGAVLALSLAGLAWIFGLS